MGSISNDLANHIESIVVSPAAAAEMKTLLNAVSVLSGTETAFIDGVTAGIGAASKALVLDSDGDLIIPDDSIVDFGPAGNLSLSADAVNGSIDNLDGGNVEIGIGSAAYVRLSRAGGTVIIEGALQTTVGLGAIVADKCSAVEGGDGVIHKTTLTFALTGAHDLDMADDDHGTGIKIYDFPAGDILILGATCNAVVTSVNAEGGGATFPMALGSVVGADDNTLTSTEADIIPSTPVAGGSAKEFHASLAASILLQNAGSGDLDLYLNAAITAAVAEGAVTIAVTGTVTITWMNLGDY